MSTRARSPYLFFGASMLLAMPWACSSEPEILPSGEGNGDGDMGGDSGDGDSTINVGGQLGDGDGDGDSKPPPTEQEFESCDGQDECAEGALCKYDVCIPELGDCSNNDDCPGDSYCDDDDICVPYGVDPDVINDPTCKRADAPPDPIPTEQCAWDGSGDNDSGFTNIYTTPIIGDLNLDDDPNRLQPSAVVTTWSGSPGQRIGILRIIDGRSCEQQLSIGTSDDPNDPDRPGYGSQLAIGDLNDDLNNGGRPEILGMHRTAAPFGNTSPLQPIAWEIVGDAGSLTLQTMWKGRVCGGPHDGDPIEFGNEWIEIGPSLFDLDDDGTPEVLVDKYVFDNDGCVLNDSIATAGNVQSAVDALYEPYLPSGNNHKGAYSAVADVDLDGEPELVRYDGIYKWQANEWVLETYADSWNAAASKPGHVAVADMGRYSNIPGHSASDPLPEVIVVSPEGDWEPNSTGSVRIVTLGGDVVYDREIPDGGPGCTTERCEHGGHGGPPTASDFDGDGEIEFAAAANAFYAVYDPDCLATGTPSERPSGVCDNVGNPLPPAGQQDGILWAVPSVDASSSQTGSSIFDFDGNGTAEAVYRDEDTLRVFNGADGTVIFTAEADSGTGSEYPSIADVDGDFATEIVYGNTDGLTILREPDDLWVSSRPIWNQHAYSITHVTDSGKVRRTRNWANNWETDGLNNFRQNTQGELGALSLADLTVELDQIEAVCNGETGPIPLYARVCNRGTNPVQDGAEVAFFAKPADAEPSDDGTKLCDAVTETLLDVGECTIVSCEAEVPMGEDVFVLVDPEGNIPDCHPGNNDGSGSSALCPAIR